MKKILLIVLLLVLVVVGYIGYINFPKLNIITGFAAKNVCSCIFEAGRDLESVEGGDNDFAPVSYASNEVDYKERSVTSAFFGLESRKAVFGEGIGCTLLPEDAEDVRPDHRPRRTFQKDSSSYPYGTGHPLDSSFANIDYLALNAAIDNAFDRNREKLKRSRAVVIIYKDHLVGEKYAPGFSPDVKLLGWSMTKSITNSVLGVLERQGRISLEQDNLFREWTGDDRAGISLNDLLQMNSGLAWEEDYSKISDVTKMLFLEKNIPQIPLNKELVGVPGQEWNYSSGTSNLLSAFIRNQFDSHQEYLDFWYFTVIDKIGMTSMILETDLAGNYIGSSYSWATARDWAKFGLLFLRKGNWNGEQILNETWVDYSTTPAPESNGEYGAHFWLSAGGKYPNVPRDLFSSNGFQGQYVFIIPSKDLVVVRFGLTEEPDFDVDTFLKEIIEAIK